MQKILSHIPGFRTKTPWKMTLAGLYYIASIAASALVNIPLGLLLLSGPFLLFYIIDYTVAQYAKSPGTRKLIALLVAAAVCGGSLIGFIATTRGSVVQADTAVFAENTTPAPAPMMTPLPTLTHGPAPPPAPDNLPLEKAIVLRNTGQIITVQFENEENGEVRMAGIEIPGEAKAEAAAYMAGAIPPGAIVYLEMDSGQAAYVWIEPPMPDNPEEARLKMLNAMLLAGGYALVSEASIDTKYTDLFARCQEEARLMCTGLWAVAAGEETIPAGAAVTPTPAPTLQPTPAPSPAPTEGIMPTPTPEKSDPSPGGVHYCGSKNSDVFHISTCSYVSSIDSKNLVTYSSREDAINKGKRPCKRCKP
jgi:endonuclease YncB( thermonuclease family)